MASNKRTIYLGLDYSQFTGGVTEVNRKMSMLDSEFKLAKEQAKNYGDATDQVGVKQDYLRQKIELQTRKVEAAKEAYEAIQNTQEAGGKKSEALQKKLLSEQTALEKLKGELNSADKAQDALNDDTKSFGDTIRGLAGDLGLSVSPAVEKLASKFDGVSASMGTAVVGIGAMIGGLVNFSKGVAQTADDLLTLSITTNMSTDEIQKLQYASSFVDVSFETLSGSMTKLTTVMASARNGSAAATESFKKLHIRVTDSHGALRDANEVFYETIDKLGKIKNETERDALAMNLFGKSAKDLSPLIEAGSDRLRELGVEAEDLGRILSSDELAQAGAFNDALDKLSESSKALKNSLGLILLPALTKVIDAIASIPTATLKTLVTLAGVIASILLIVKAIKSVTDTASGIKNMISMVSGGMSKTTLIIMGVVTALIALAAIIAVIIGKKNDLKETMESVGNTVNGLQGTVSDAQNASYYAQRHASGTTNYRGGRTWVGEEGPELVTLPKGSQITPADQVGRTEYNTFNVTIDAKSVSDFQRVVDICMGQKVALRRA